MALYLRSLALLPVAVVLLARLTVPASAEKKYGPGVTDAESKIDSYQPVQHQLRRMARPSTWSTSRTG
jgi:hypothetical protein